MTNRPLSATVNAVKGLRLMSPIGMSAAWTDEGALLGKVCDEC